MKGAPADLAALAEIDELMRLAEFRSLSVVDILSVRDILTAILDNDFVYAVLEVLYLGIFFHLVLEIEVKIIRTAATGDNVMALAGMDEIVAVSAFDRVIARIRKYVIITVAGIGGDRGTVDDDRFASPGADEPLLI